MRPSALAGLGLWVAALVALGAAALGGPWYPRERGTAAARRICLLDLSASVLRPRPDWLPWVREQLARQAERAAAGAQELAVYGYGDGVRELLAAGPPQRLLDRLAGRGPAFDPLGAGLGEGATDLALALDRVAPELAAADRAPGTLVLVGADGRGRGDLLPRLADLARRGVTLQWVAPPAPSRLDVELVALRLPAEPAPGSPLVAAVELRARGPAPPPGVELWAEVVVEAPSGPRSLEVPLPWPSGESTVLHRSPERTLALGTVEDGRTAVAVRLVRRGAAAADAPDPVPENDRAAASLRSGPRRVVGLCRDPGHGAAAAALVARFAAEAELQWVPLAPGEVAAALPDLDALVVLDVPLADLPTSALSSAVARGLGFGHLWGWACGGPAPAGVVEELSALVPGHDDAPPREVVLLVDGSGSMAGATFDEVRRAAVELARAAGPSDRLWLRFFTGALHPAQAFGEGGDDRSDWVERLLRLRAPQGPTALLRSVEELAGERARVAARPALVLLLSDGREEGDPVDEEARAERLRAELADSRTELRALAVGERLELSTLARLVAAPEHLQVVGDARELATLVVRAAAERALVPGPVELEVPAGELAAQVFGAEREAIRPRLDRLWRARPGPGAEVVWQAPEGEPALGLRRRGAGRLATLAAAPEAEFAPAFARAPSALLPVVRWLADGPRPAPWQVTVESAGEGGAELVVEGGLEPLPAALEVRLLGPAATLRARALPPALPGRGGERRLPWPPAGYDPQRHARGDWVDLLLGEGLAAQPWTLGAPRPAEFGESEPLPTLPPPDPVRGARGPHPAAPWLLAAAGLLALVSGMVRARGSRPIKPSPSADR